MDINRGMIKPMKPREVAIFIGYIVAFGCIILSDYFY